ncbi:MAG: tail fiber protein [Halioglobus sp.]|nr:tail fiber protein [Halioglobus sp.]
MSEPYLSEIRIIGFNFAPRNWALCDGQILPINQNQSLYSLLGTTYGGDGRTTFALPDLRGRVPTHFSSSNRQGTRAGEEEHALTDAEIPAHGHAMSASSANADLTNPSDAMYASTADARRAVTPYTSPDNLATMTPTGGTSAGHENMQPYLALNFAIALRGVFPSRN